MAISRASHGDRRKPRATQRRVRAAMAASSVARIGALSSKSWRSRRDRNSSTDKGLTGTVYGTKIFLVTKRVKLLDTVLTNPRDVRFADLCRLVEALGFRLDRQVGSHRIYVHPTPAIPFVNVQEGRAGKRSRTW